MYGGKAGGGEGVRDNTLRGELGTSSSDDRGLDNGEERPELSLNVILAVSGL